MHTNPNRMSPFHQTSSHTELFTQSFIFHYEVSFDFIDFASAMKRDREEREIDMANCLMLLSKVGHETNPDPAKTSPGRLFECKTCNKKFSSFQALGGHRASHRKPKMMGEDLFKIPDSPPKPKTHECSICGQEFAIGQALGGHMRRHRPNNSSTSPMNDDEVLVTRPLLPAVPVLKKSNSKRVIVCLDLNLTPLENDLKQLGMMTASAF